ncbi:hypothetical protein Syun_008702 [Stephania yunnanensis]|uniref:Uncharacterized protein n=1 Tax=Stephania yunnanensis TaxID=152371 RepID=A0AAP0KEU1_9MAGN
MAQEEQQRCSNSSSGGGGRTTKKLKQRKIPQRGLGVAQLEKIRLEEQQKGNSHSNHQSTSAIVFAPPSPTDLSSFRPSTPISPSNFEKLSPPPSISSTSLLYGHNNGETHDLGVSAAMAEGQGHGFLPNMWSTFELNTDSEDKKLDPGLEFGQSVINESNQLWPPLLMQRKQEPPQPRQQYITSKVMAQFSNQKFLNDLLVFLFSDVTKKPGLQVKLSMSIPQSSGLNLQIEPPSNQSYTSNFTAPLWHEEYKGYTEEFFRQGASIRQQPFYSFFPTKRHQMGSYTVAPNEQRCELEEGLDLTLKL